LKECIKKLEETEKSQFPQLKIKRIILTTLVILLISTIKGGKGLSSPLGIEYCGHLYWFINIVLVLVAQLFVRSFGEDIIAFNKEKER
jgi:hypothetical protein